MSTIQNILFRDAHSLPVAYSHDSPHHTLILQAREFVRSLLRSPRGMQALREITNQCEKARSQPHGISPVDSEDLMNRFISAMKSEADFPAIIADAVVTDGLGELSKGNGDPGAEVQLRNFQILINHPRVEQMVKAHQREATELNVYKMQLRCTILHLMGQTFAEYLAYSMCSLPPLKEAPHGPHRSPFHTVIEEAGRTLERVVLGSYLSWSKDPRCDDPQPGLPYLAELDPEHRFMGSWTLVSPESINQLASDNYEYPLVVTTKVLAHEKMKDLFA